MAQIDKIRKNVIQHGPIQIAFQVKNDLFRPVEVAKINAKDRITYENKDSVKE